MCDQNANNPPLNVTPQSAALTSLPKAVERLMLSQGINQSGREQEFVSFLHMFFMFHVKDNTPCGANLLFKFTQGHTRCTVRLVPHGQTKLIGKQEKLRSPKRSFRQPAGSLTKLFFPSLSCPPLMNIHAEHPERPWYEGAQMEKPTKLFSFTFRKLAHS